MRRARYKILLLGLVSLLSGLALSACSNVQELATATPSPTALKAELTVWAWGQGLKGLQANLPGFSHTYPNVKVNLVEVPNPEIYTKLDKGLQAGGVGLPDVIEIETERLEYYTGKYLEAFTNIKSWATQYEGQFNALQWTAVQRIGRFRAVPWYAGPAGLFYRADLFAKAGIDPSSIQTWDDFIKAGPKFKAANPGVKMLTIDLTEDTLFRAMLYQQNAGYYTQDMRINFMSPEGIRAMNVITELAQAGLLYTVDGKGGVIPALGADLGASYVAGADWAGALEDDAPKMAGKWDVMPLPAFGPEGSRTANIGGSALAALRTGKQQDAALAFIEYCLTSKDNQNLMLKEAGVLPAFLPAYSDAFYNLPQPYFNNQPIWQFFASEARELKPTFYNVEFPDAAQAILIGQRLAVTKLETMPALQQAANELRDKTAREIFKPGDPTPTPTNKETK
jgi:lactose/L-arabinose transport system substrate-binding protein